MPGSTPSCLAACVKSWQRMEGRVREAVMQMFICWLRRIAFARRKLKPITLSSRIIEASLHPVNRPPPLIDPLRVCSVAYAAQNGIAQNRVTLLDSGRKMQGVAAYLPTVQGVLSKIRLRRNRDTLIIAILIGVLLALTFIYASRGGPGK